MKVDDELLEEIRERQENLSVTDLDLGGDEIHASDRVKEEW